jgi:hypothetical protein
MGVIDILIEDAEIKGLEKGVEKKYKNYGQPLHRRYAYRVYSSCD